MQFKKASKAQAKARVAIFGPSGAGKTFSSLSIAQGLGEKLALLDTERGSASKYADRFTFDTLDLVDRTIENYANAIELAATWDGGADVLIVDSLSHAWQELLDEVNRLAKAKYRGNTWSAWSEGTPMQRRLVDAILQFPGHIIVTMRSKTEWVTEDNNGKKRPVRVGMAPEQGKGIEYEFDLLLEMSTDHIANVIKDRSGKFQDKIIEKPDKLFGQTLAAWLSDGDAPAPKKKSAKKKSASTDDICGDIFAVLTQIDSSWSDRAVAHVDELMKSRAAEQGKTYDTLFLADQLVQAKKKAQSKEATA